MLRYTDGEAGFMDARRIVDRMFVAGLHPDWASVSSLLDTVSQDSRNGTCMMWQIDQVAINGSFVVHDVASQIGGASVRPFMDQF